jgi:general secretion pathway protein D
LRAIAQAGKAKVLSRPSILARNNQPATITVGQSVPLISSVSYNGLNGTPINAISYRDVGVILKVTPFITADGLVEMMVSPQISSIDPNLSIPISVGVSAPVIDIRAADTVAVTADGQTVIIGGLMETDKSQTDTKIPVLGDIPLLGNLFKRKIKSDTKTELAHFPDAAYCPKPKPIGLFVRRETTKGDAMKALSEQELHKFLDTLPTVEPPLTTNAPPGSGWSNKNK